MLKVAKLILFDYIGELFRKKLFIVSIWDIATLILGYLNSLFALVVHQAV